MSEFPDDSFEHPQERSAICLLRNEMRLKGETYTDMLFIMQNYIETDLDMPADLSLRELLRLEKSGVLPDETLYEIDPVSALEKHRMAVYTTWMPIYQLTHTSEEFERWLPYALEIVLPDDSRHDDDICADYSFRENPYDESCYMALQCPVRHIGNQVVYELSNFNKDTPDYYHDREKACRNTQLLISGVARYGIISDVQKATVEAAYLRRYSQEFPKPDLSQ